MKNYNVPEIELLTVNALDVIQTSGEVELTNPSELNSAAQSVVPNAAYKF